MKKATRSLPVLVAGALLGVSAVGAAQTKPHTASSATPQPTPGSDAPATNAPLSEKTGSGAPAATPPNAESIDEAGAQRHFQLGKMLMEAQNYAAACSAFEKSLEYVDGVGTRYNLAICYERSGRLADAHQLLLNVSERTTASGDERRAAAARARMNQLENELARVTVVVSKPTPDLRLFRRTPDSQLIPLPADATTQRLFLDPGSHEFVARAPGRQRWTQTISPEANESLTLIVPELPELRADEEPSNTGQPAGEADLEDSGAVDSRGAGWGWVPPVALGVGAAGLFAGIAYTQQYRASHEDAKAICPESRNCQPGDPALHDRLVEDSRRYRSRAALGYALGALGLTLGAIYYLTRSSAEAFEGNADFAIDAVVSDEQWGGVVRGRF